MKTDNMFFRLPSGTKSRITLLAKKHEPLTNVIVRALDALEAMSDSAGYSQIASDDSAGDSAGYSQIADRLAAIEARLTALETGNKKPVMSNVISDVPTDKDDALLWAAELIRSGASLKDVNSALLSKGFVGKNPSRLKDKLISLGLLDNDGGGGGGDELQTELTVKSHCE